MRSASFSIRMATTLHTLQWLSKEYHDLNGIHYETLDKPPSALEFSRLVHISRPVVIKGFELHALERWTDAYLIEQMGDRKISVAVTPNGRADAITRGPDGKLYFVEPHTQQMTMHNFLLNLAPNTDRTTWPEEHQEIYYLQSQNGNMYTSQFFDSFSDQERQSESFEFEPLRADVPSEIPWCSQAFDRSPDAVNLWIGDSRSVTSIHSDPYENIYTVIRGTKYFTLLPPTEGWCLQGSYHGFTIFVTHHPLNKLTRSERAYPHAIYTRPSPASALKLTPSPLTTSPIRWSSILNPHLPDTVPPEAHPLHISLKAGETLYLPAGWWHHVRQGVDSEKGEELKEDKTIAVNWWYDFEGRGMGWVWLNFLRGGHVPDGNTT